jgi:hypothetical protein
MNGSNLLRRPGDEKLPGQGGITTAAATNTDRMYRSGPAADDVYLRGGHAADDSVVREFSCSTCQNKVECCFAEMRAWLSEGGDLSDFFNFYAIPASRQKELDIWCNMFIELFTSNEEMHRIRMQFVRFTGEILASDRARAAEELGVGVSDMPKNDWNVMDAGQKKTRIELFLEWDVESPQVRTMLRRFIATLSENGIMQKILTELEIPADQVDNFIRFLTNGPGVPGFLNSIDLASMKDCCTANMRLSPN